MATAKKKTTTTKKAATIKKSTAPKKAAAKKTTTKRVVASSKKAPKAVKSLVPRLESESPEAKFLSFNPTIQTLYWVVIGVICICFTLWIAKLQSDINAIYDSIDATQSSVYSTTPIVKK